MAALIIGDKIENHKAGISIFQNKRIPPIGLIISIILLCTFSISFSRPGPNMKDGLWEITTNIEMPGMPMKMPAMTHTHCITQENAVPDNSPPAQECKIIENQKMGDIVTLRYPEMKNPHHWRNQLCWGYIFKGTIKIAYARVFQKLNGR
jgi:hypothetical protein